MIIAGVLFREDVSLGRFFVTCLSRSSRRRFQEVLAPTEIPTFARASVFVASVSLMRSAAHRF